MSSCVFSLTGNYWNSIHHAAAPRHALGELMRPATHIEGAEGLNELLRRRARTSRNSSSSSSSVWAVGGPSDLLSFVLARKGALIASLAHHTVVFASAQPHTATTHRHHNQKRCHRHQPKGDLYVCLLIRQSTCLDQHRCVHHAAAAAATAPHTRGAHTSTHTAVQAATHGHTDSLTRTTHRAAAQELWHNRTGTSMG